ncbi:TonB family protein [Sphingomonas kyeonggiensis]|uniref:energy transducer TonB n=1 Tax=Sphingomonas kyeonggiensis TaxID=1268553 RepID=UPI0027850A4E|nr:energy transducer TonB [Sphingomonas kyeonggiensis]MDQ0250636.1 TonB family protein [Sphingomonas kyeonggiensis]
MIAMTLLLGMALAMQDAGATTRPTPRGRPQAWVTDEDYPAAAMWERQAGAVAARLDLDAQGVPTACKVTRSSGSAVLDSTTCTLMQARARFNPARDAAGKAVAGAYPFTFTWVLPQGEAGFGSWLYFNQIRITGDGRIAGCMAQSRGMGFSRATGGVCNRLGAPVSPAMMALLGKSGAGATVQVIEAHMVNGEAIPVIDRPASKPFYERKIRFDVDAAGNVTNCKLAGGAAAQDPLGLVLHRCHSGFRYPAQPGGRRSVEMTVSMYLTHEPPPPRDPAEGPTV